MIDACTQFLNTRLATLLLTDNSPAYPAQRVFYGNMPRNWLRDNGYGINCMLTSDRKRRDGAIISRKKNTAGTHYEFTRRVYKRTVVYRVLLHAATFGDLWVSQPSRPGLMDQFQEEMARHRMIADSGNHAVLVTLHDAVRPWNRESEIQQDLMRRLPHRAIVRVEFTGGLFRTYQVPIIPSVNLANGAGMA